MTRWYWLSFADPSRPEGEQFLGVIIMPVTEDVIELAEQFDDESHLFEKIRERGEDVSFLAAVSYASLKGINPGGEVRGFEITEKIDKVPLSARGVLLSKQELEQLEGRELRVQHPDRVRPVLRPRLGEDVPHMGVDR